MTAPLGPYRLGALAERVPGMCAICDGPVPYRRNWGDRESFTCGSIRCRQTWTNLASYDAKARAPGMVSR